MNELLRHHVARPRKNMLFAVLGATCLLLLPIALILLHRSFAEAELREKLAQLTRAGMVISGEDINRLYHGHGGDPAGNAAPVYESAFAAMVLRSGPIEEVNAFFQLKPGFAPIESETFAAMAEVVAANETALALLREAVAYPYLRHDLDFTDGVDLLLPHVGQLRNAARLLGAEAIVAAEEGDSTRAAEAIQAIFQIVLHLAEEPTLISHLTRIAMESIGKTALERVLERVELDPAVLADLREILETLEDGARMRIALAGELSFGLSVYEMVADGEPDILGGDLGPLEEVVIPLYSVTGLLARDKLNYLKLMEEVSRLAALPLPDRLTARWPDPEFSVNPLHGQLILHFIFPTMGRVFEADNRAITSLRATRIALAAEQHRMEHGEYPKQLEDLVPDYFNALPRDPYTADGRFQWVHNEEGAFVRSAAILVPPSGAGHIYSQFRLPPK